MKSHNEFLKEVKEKTHFTNLIKKSMSPESEEDLDVEQEKAE